MNTISYKKLQESIDRLKEQYKNFLILDQKKLAKIDKEAVKESVIQRFEICYDIFFKSLRKYLESQGFVLKSQAPKAILRKTHENGLIDQEKLAQWFNYIDLRIGTAHDYSQPKADKALSQIGFFIKDIESIYKTIQIS